MHKILSFHLVVYTIVLSLFFLFFVKVLLHYASLPKLFIESKEKYNFFGNKRINFMVNVKFKEDKNE